jgi:hypothetical protein
VTSTDNVTRLPHKEPELSWVRKINIPLPVLPPTIRQRLRTPGFWTGIAAIAVFCTAYVSGRLPDTLDIVVALVVTGFVVFLSAVGMVCQTIRDTHPADGRQARAAEPASENRTAA